MQTIKYAVAIVQLLLTSHMWFLRLLLEGLVVAVISESSEKKDNLILVVVQYQ